MYVQRIMFYMADAYKLEAYSQTGSNLRACSIWSFDDIIYIGCVFERFMAYVMKFLIDINLAHSIEYMF